MIRTVIQAFWAAVLGLSVVDDWIAETGLNPELAKAAAVPVSIAVVVGISQLLPDTRVFWRLLAVAINGVPKSPGYQDPQNHE